MKFTLLVMETEYFLTLVMETKYFRISKIDYWLIIDWFSISSTELLTVIERQKVLDTLIYSAIRWIADQTMGAGGSVDLGELSISTPGRL